MHRGYLLPQRHTFSELDFIDNDIEEIVFDILQSEIGYPNYKLQYKCSTVANKLTIAVFHPLRSLQINMFQLPRPIPFVLGPKSV